jgi:hypothetical protein
VTFNLFAFRIVSSPFVHQRAIAITRQLQLLWWRLTGPFLERVHDVHCFRERGDVEHAVFELRLNPDFSNAWADTGHRLPIFWVESSLDPTELEAAAATGDGGKRPDVATRTPEPRQRLVRHGSLCKYLYILSTGVAERHTLGELDVSAIRPEEYQAVL